MNRIRIIRGFTLIELLVVIAIIMIMLAMILGIAEYARRAAKESKAKASIQRIHNALQEYKLDNGSFPTNLITCDITIWTNHVKYKAIANYLPAGFSFNDPWGSSYRYTNMTREQYKVWSCGVDTNTGYTEFEGDDIE